MQESAEFDKAPGSFRDPVGFRAASFEISLGSSPEADPDEFPPVMPTPPHERGSFVGVGTDLVEHDPMRLKHFQFLRIRLENLLLPR